MTFLACRQKTYREGVLFVKGLRLLNSFDRQLKEHGRGQHRRATLPGDLASDVSSRQRRPSRALGMMVEGLRQLASVFGPSHSPHQVMEGPDGVIPQC